MRYVVDECLAGRAPRLSQFSIGVDVFDRDSSFDPTIDSIVRVEAGRIRAKLAEFYLGPGKDDQVQIRLPKGGYAVDIQFKQNLPRPSHVPEPEQRPWFVYAMVLLAVLASAVVAVFILLPGTGVIFSPKQHAEIDPAVSVSRPAPAAKEAIAVLPFDNMSANPNEAYFSDGITEDIITDLSIVSGLKVIARHSTFVYKDKSLSIRDIGRQLGVDYVVEGSVRKHDGRLRITAQLIDVATESHIWAERFDRVLDDVFEIQEEVSRKIVSALEIALTDREKARLGHRNTESVAAHDLYLRGQDQFYRYDKFGILQSINYFSEAIRIDPAYAEAYAWKSRALVCAFLAGFVPDKNRTIDRALQLANDAIARDRLLPMAYANLAWAKRWDGQIDSAAATVSQAIELDSNFADAYLWQSLILSTGKKGEQALASIRQAFRLNPKYGVTYIFALGRAYFALGDIQAALVQFDRGIDRNSSFLPNHVYKIFALESIDDVAAAQKVRDGLTESHPGFEQSASYRYYFLEDE